MKEEEEETGLVSPLLLLLPLLCLPHSSSSAIHPANLPNTPPRSPSMLTSNRKEGGRVGGREGWMT